MSSLAGKVALVTGAASGIGRATAVRFAAEGARVVAVDRSADGLHIVTAEIAAVGGQAHAAIADVAFAAQVEDAIAAGIAAFGRLDVVFNGVGISGRRWGDGPIDQCTVEGWDYVLSTNLTSMFLVCKFAVPHLLATGGGAIVNLASVLGLVGGDEDFATHAYAASKGGIIAMSRAMAV